MGLADQGRQLQDLIGQVGYRSEHHPVFVQANATMDIEALIWLAISELNELAQEEDKREGQAPSREWVMEFTDYVVVLRSIILRYAPKVSAESMRSSVNGQYKGSFNSLHEQTLNITEGNAPRNLEFLFTELLSLAKYAGVEIQASLFAGFVNKRLGANRPKKYFQNEPGMNDLDVLAKRDHAFKVLRQIRTFLKRATGRDVELQPWITDFFDPILEDWRHSDLAIQSLEQRIKAFQKQVKDEVAKVLLNQNPDQRKKDPNLELKMLIAGAVPIQSMDKMPPLRARQNPVTNASLVQVVS